jgi:predicted transcriptional regulator of viral defense system
MIIYDLVAKYHYSQVINNEKYRKALAPKQELDVEEFKKFLQRLEDMKEENNIG